MWCHPSAAVQRSRCAGRENRTAGKPGMPVHSKGHRATLQAANTPQHKTGGGSGWVTHLDGHVLTVEALRVSKRSSGVSPGMPRCRLGAVLRELCWASFKRATPPRPPVCCPAHAVGRSRAPGGVQGPPLPQAVASWLGSQAPLVPAPAPGQSWAVVLLLLCCVVCAGFTPCMRATPPLP